MSFVLSILIGGVTFTGSLVAWGKLGGKLDLVLYADLDVDVSPPSPLTDKWLRWWRNGTASHWLCDHSPPLVSFDGNPHVSEAALRFVHRPPPDADLAMLAESMHPALGVVAVVFGG